MQTTVEITKKVFEVSLQTYVQAVITKHRSRNKKTLTPQQVRFLTYPFITSVYWAKCKRKRVSKRNLALYSNTKQKQYALDFEMRGRKLIELP